MDAHQTTIFSAVLISGSIIGVIIIYFIVSIIYQQRRSHLLYKRAIEAEITTLEKERSRIAADLHDDLGPLVSSIKFSVGSLDVYSETDTKTVDRVFEHIDSLMQRMREISNDMMPQTLLRKGLVAAIEEYIDNIQKPDTLQIQFIYDDTVNLPGHLTIHLYRIVQEIIHNAIKHSNANSLKIELKQENNAIVLLSADNGNGFDYNLQSRENRGLGLRNLFSRTEMLGAAMYVESAPGKGCRYTIEIPPTTDL